MNPDQPSRDQIETRITALLLGELPPDEAALLRYTMAQDPALQQLHDELQATLVLVREAAKHPAEALVEKNAPLKLKLSAERRQQLLAQFKTPRPKASPQPLFWLKRIEMPAPMSLLVGALVVVFILGLAAISIPNFVTARSTSQSNAVINNLRQMDAAKQQWALDNGKSGNDAPTRTDLRPYLREIKPVMGESYVLGKVSEPVIADVGVGEAKKQFSTLSVTMPRGGASEESRGQYGARAFGTRSTLVESLSDLAGKVLPANHASQEAMAASPASAPSGAFAPVANSALAGAPVQVTLAPEPQLAPPPVAAPPVQIVLPQPESAPEIAAQAGAPVETEKGSVYSQNIVGYANVPAGSDHLLSVPFTTSDSSVPAAPAPAPGGSASPQAETDSGQLAYYKGNRIETVDKLDRKEHIENQWTVPAQAREVPGNGVAGDTGDGGGPGGFFARMMAANSSSSQNSLLQQRSLNANTTMGTTTSSSGIGTSTGAGGGGFGGGAFGGGGFGGGGFGGGGFGTASGGNNGRPTPQPAGSAVGSEATSPAVEPPPFVGSPTPVLALNDSGVNRSIGGNPPYAAGHGFPTLGPIGQFGSAAAEATPQPEALAASAAPQTLTISPNGISPQHAKDEKLFMGERSKAQLPKVEPLKTVNTDQFENSITQSRAVGSAGNRFYRNPAQESEQKKVPLLGDVPVVGGLFQSSLNDNARVPTAAPAPVVAAAPAVVPSAAFEFNAGAPTVSGSTPDSGASARDQSVTVFKMNNANPEQTAQVLQSMFASGNRSSQSSSSSQNSLLQQRSMSTTVAFNTAPTPSAAGNTLGAASDSFNNGVAKEAQPLPSIATGGSVNLVEENKLSDAERTRELQKHQPNQQGTGLYLPPNVTVAAPSAAQESYLEDLQAQFQDQEKQIRIAQDKIDALRQKLHIADQNPHATAPSPTMDAQQLQTINSQRIEQEKAYHEQSAQLQELKAIEKTNKEKLAEVLPQMVQDATLNDLLSKREEAGRNLTTPTKDLAATDTTVTRSRAQLEQLNHEIDDRETGIMAGLESKVNSTKAALEAMSASVEEAKKKDQEDAQENQPYYNAQRDLQQKLKMHEMLYSKLEAEKVDAKLDSGPPVNSMVQITDPAQPGRSQNFWQRLTGQVESTARVKVENDVTDIPGLSGTPMTTSFDPYFIQTTFEIIQSEAVLGKAVDALNLQTAWASKNSGQKLTKSEAIAQLKQRLDLQPVANTKLIEIGAKSDDPKEAADIANAVAKAYADYRLEARRQLTTNGLAVLEDQFGKQAKEIQLAQAEVDRLGKDLAPQQNQPEPMQEPTDLPLRKPAPNAPVPQPEILARDNNFSTFSLNVSDVSFKFAEASLQNGKLPDTASIRSEEFINAFDYRDPEAAAGQPMAFASERARYPFAHNRELLRFAVKTAAAGRPAGRALNLVLLLDNSGSMERADRVAIIRESLRVLATQLQPQDTVSVVTFARAARLWADGISGDKAGETLDQVGGITPEGGTNLEEAMRLAYETAYRHYLPNGLNRVVLLTDGAANLGNVEPETLKQKVEAQRKQGIALDCFGIGWEDYNDDLLEQLSSNGDGRYAFLNSPEDASKDFATKLAGALQIAAADVKVQVEFNPGRVISYRQIGYARHQLTKEQFRDNTVAAGEIAAQEAGNALYTIETNPNGDGPIATVHVRYRIPGTSDYREHSWDVAYTGSAPALDQSSPAMRLAATASAFSEWLAASPYAQEVTLDELLKILRGVPEVYGADDRPKQLETMIREAKSLEGK